MDDRAYLEQLLHQDIPLTQALGLSVLDWSHGELRLSLPLAANLNHKSSMFGGSLYSLSVLAGWEGVIGEDGTAVPFSPEAARTLLDAYPGSPSVVALAYIMELSAARRKN